ncbi:MAG: glycosyltransferase [Chitinophagales bacterium]
MKLLFLVPYPQSSAPSQRFRFEQYFTFLKEKGLEFDVQSFIDDATWKVLYQKGRVLKKLLGILKGFLRRFLILFQLRKYDYVFIHREAAPIGPPVFEYLIAKVFRKKIIFDFDDAIWLENVSDSNKLFSKTKFYGKTKKIIQWAYKISCGNEYLCEYARQFNQNVVLNPTTIDRQNLHKEVKDQNSKKPAIGWTGSHSTVKYLNEIIPVIKKLEDQIDFEFILISDRKPDWNLKSLKFIPWTKETEVGDLLRFNIGLMPIPDDEWTRGKCGFKALQYMSLGIPALVSPVAVNKNIVDNGINGFWCNSPEEWEERILELLNNQALRIKMGKAAIEKIKSEFSVSANKNNFISLFK